MIFLLLNSVSVLCVFQKNGHGWVNIVTFVPMQGPYKQLAYKDSCVWLWANTFP